MTIFLRGSKFLNRYYQWVSVPDLFPAWHVPVVLDIMLDPRNPTPPTGWAWVKPDEPIDLDTLEVVRF